MTNPRAEYLGYRERSRDIDEMLRRTVWGSQTYVPGAGSVMNVRGTDYLDEDVPVLNFGYSFNLPQDSNAEVITLAINSDTNQKMALPTLPRDQQRQWPEGSGGIQHPTNPNMYIQFSDNGAVLDIAGTTVTVADDGAVTITTTNQVTVDAPQSQFTGDVAIDGSLFVNGAAVEHQGTNIGDTHVHPQGPDSAGDGQQNTQGPQ